MLAIGLSRLSCSCRHGRATLFLISSVNIKAMEHTFQSASCSLPRRQMHTDYLDYYLDCSELLASQWFFNMEIYCSLNRIFSIAPKFTNSSWNRWLVLYLWFEKRIWLVAMVEVCDLEIVLRKALDRAHFTVNCTHLQSVEFGISYRSTS